MERDTKRCRLNISEEHKSFLWTPAKTASEHATMVFSCLSFGLLDCSYDRKIIYDVSDFPAHSHSLNLFEGHEDYKLICTARNPIHRVFSAFVYSNRFQEKLHKSDFISFFNKIIDNNDFLWLGTIKTYLREPDYYIRIENMYEDYMKIPFIANSKLAESGTLFELCSRRKNVTRKFDIKIEDFYTPDMIDYLYSQYKEYFDKLGYKPEL